MHDYEKKNVTFATVRHRIVSFRPYMWSSTANESGTKNSRNGRDTFWSSGSGSAAQHRLAIDIHALTSTRVVATRAAHREGADELQLAPLQLECLSDFKLAHADP